jgi:hypothetical protein
MKENFLKQNRQKRLKNRQEPEIWKNKRQIKFDEKNQSSQDENFVTLIEKSQKIIEKPKDGEAVINEKKSDLDEKASES